MSNMRTKLAAALLLKRAFTPNSQLGGMDPAAMGGAPMDPAAMGGAPAPAAPADPAAGMDPAAMGGAPMDPAAAGGAPMDPAAMGGAPMGPGGQEPDPMQMPITMLSVGDLVQLIGEVTAATISGEFGDGIEEEGAPPEGGSPEPAPKTEDPGSSKPSGEEKIVSRLDQLIEMLGGAPGGPEATPAGPMAGAPAPGAPKMASVRPLDRVRSVLRGANDA